MMRFARASAILALVSVLGLTAVAVGLARGQPVAVGTVEICRGLTVVSVPVDADGKPAGHAHLCPEGLQALFAAADGGIALASVDAVLQPTVWQAPRTLVPRRVALGPRARGPPLSL